MLRGLRGAESVGVTTGFSDGTFRGGQTIVRQDTAAFLGRMIDKDLIKLGRDPGQDKGWCASWRAAPFGIDNGKHPKYEAPRRIPWKLAKMPKEV